MFDDFVSHNSTPLFKGSTGDASIIHLLWGDGVRFETGSASNGRRKVKARGITGWVKQSALGGGSLLEFYFIDVGQGDGVLIKTPSFRHIMIDGGFPRSVQDTGKNAADFVDWKFSKDYEMSEIEIDTMLVSHCDADHYGGLWNLLDVSKIGELDAEGVSVEELYHAGLSWWKAPSGGKTLGPSKSANGEKFWTRLLGNRTSVGHAISSSGSSPKLHGWWRNFMGVCHNAKTKGGSSTPISRLSHADDFVPGYEPDSIGEPSIKILGPVEFEIDGKPALRKFPGGNSKNTNGVSLLLRVDFGRTRVMLTGDLNKASQKAILDDYAGERLEFECDVAKGCHHGSDDISYEFLQAMRPAATVISSGDNEGHDHPRPSVMAASATTGFLEIKDGDLVTPLVYCTELGRSVDLGFPKKFKKLDNGNNVVDEIAGASLDRCDLEITKAKKKSVKMEDAMVVGGLIYGLVNVRTDGEKILCATLDESNSKWRIKTFKSRF